MTVKKATKCGGYAAVVARQRLQNTNQQIDMMTLTKSSIAPNYNIIVGFNEKDQLQLITKEEITKLDTDDKIKLLKDHSDHKVTKYENIPVDDITNCDNVENYPNCNNTLVFYLTKNLIKEAVAIKFENEQDFKRIYFTYKYFKMRNRLTKNTYNNHISNDNIFSKKKTYDFKTRKSSIDDNFNTFNINRIPKAEFDLMQTTDNDGVTHISVQQKNSKYDQPMSLIGIRSDGVDLGEIDSIIYTDIDIPPKPDRKRLFQRTKPKAPSPPSIKESQKVLKGDFVRVNVERVPDVIPKENKFNKIPDILLFRDNKTKTRTNATSNLWLASNKVSATGYESDREEWRSSRSQFSTTAFDSLARPTKIAMALTLKKPQRLEPVPQYYRLSSDPTPKINSIPFRPNNFFPRPPRLPRPTVDLKRTALSTDHRKFTSLQNLDIPRKLSEPKKADTKKNYSNISTRITGLTNKLRDLGNPSNTLGRFKAQSHSDVANLKPVLKCNGVDGSKRPVVRTCSAEPPKKVTFSAFATVQVV